MSGFEIHPYIPPPAEAARTPKTTPSGSDESILKMLYAAILSIMGANTQALRNYYLKALKVGQNWLNHANGVNGALYRNPGDMTQQQWDAFANGWEFLKNKLAEWKKEHPNAKPPLPPVQQQLEKILSNKGLQKLFALLKKLQGTDNELAAMKKRLENGKPVDLAKYKKLKEQQKAETAAAAKQLTDVQTPTTPAGQASLKALESDCKTLVQYLMTPETILGKEAMKLVNNIAYLARFMSSNLKKGEGVAELIISNYMRR